MKVREDISQIGIENFCMNHSRMDCRGIRKVLQSASVPFLKIQRGLSIELQLRNSFTNSPFDSDKKNLAKAGFCYSGSGHSIICVSCHIWLDIDQYCHDDILRLHQEKQPNCKFARSPDRNAHNRCKKFSSMDSLRFESERLQTFIEWQDEWVSPKELAAEGFFSLRISDICVCFFCYKIISAGEDVDSVRGKQKCHVSCKLKQGEPVGNVPMSCCEILEKLYPQRLPASSYKDRYHLNCGLHKHSRPKWMEYIIVRERLKSYDKWPGCVVQTPEELAEAGFFSCGLSDHVKCYHCGGGLRNWEIDDDPWEEHARWYPDCTFVHLAKGPEFIDEVLTRKPPFLCSSICGDGPSHTVDTSGKLFKIDENDLDTLMTMDVLQHATERYPTDIVKRALCLQLEKTGSPFFSVESCVDTVRQLMLWDARPAPQEAQSAYADIISRETENDTEESVETPVSTVPLAVDVVDSAQITSASTSFITDSQTSAQDQTTKDVRIVELLDQFNRTHSAENFPPGPPVDWLCKVCMNAPMTIIFLPCSHMATCFSCAAALENCPICRHQIICTVRSEIAK